ncbi:hypothetical protein A7317_10940 [Pseudomonas fluorescens]|nr:hypothetical protein A7317_10940 [Pseudomonas fluorescens]
MLAGRAVLGHDHGFADAVLLSQARFDFAQFDAEAADLHLMVDAAEVVHHAVRAATGQVAAAVHAAAGFAEGVWHEAFGGQGRTFQVTPGHTLPAQVQLAGHADGLQVELRVQHIAAAVAEQCADGRIDRPAWVPLAGLPQQRRDHGFGRAVAIEQVGRFQRTPGQVVAGLRHRVTAEAVHPHGRWVAVALGMLGQLLQVHRREHGHRHLVAMHLRVGVFGQPQAVIADQHARAVDQRVHPAFVGAVEGERHEVQFAIGRRGFIALAGRNDVRHQRAVGHRHALGQAGGAGGVDHVGEVVAVQLHVWSRVAVIGPFLGAIDRQTVETFGNRQLLQRPRMRQQQPGAAVLHHVQQAITRVFDIQRHIHPTRLQHGEERHHDLGAARHGNRHAHFRAHTTGDQCAGQAVGLAVQLAVSQGLRVELHRHGLRCFSGAVGDQFVHQARGREAGIGAVPQLQDVLLAHQHIRPDACLEQTMGQAIGAAVQLGIAQRYIAEAQRWRLRCTRDLRFYQLMHATLHWVVPRGGVPLVNDLLALSRVQHRQVLQRQRRVGHGHAQQAQPVAQHARRRGGAEQVGGVGQRGPHAVGAFLGVQAQVELGAAGLPFQVGHAQARQLPGARLGVGLMVEHHLEQRVVAQAAFRLQRLDQLLEGQVLVGLGFQGAALGVLEQLSKAHLAVEIGLEHLGVDEKADQRFGLDAVAVGNRHADPDVLLAAVAIQKRLERRQQQHEQRHAFTLGQGFHPGHQRGFQGDVLARAQEALLRRTRVIEGQLQHRLRATEQLTPIGQLPRLLARFHPAALP